MRLALMLAALGVGVAAFVLVIAAALNAEWLLAVGDAVLVVGNAAVFAVNLRDWRSEVRP